MRILTVSDLHYTLPQLDFILNNAPDFDAVVLGGDLLDISSLVPLESQIVVIQTYVRRIAESTLVFACSGNHDLTARNHHDEKFAPWLEQTDVHGVIVDGKSLDVDGVRITVCPWWDGPATRDDVAAQLAAASLDRPATWVWIYHHPPDEAPVSWVGSRNIGDRDLNGWIDQYRPDLVITGHLHETPFREGGSWLAQLGSTWVVNAGRSTGPIPTHAIVDLSTGEAEWWSPYGQDHQTLWPAEVG